MPIKFDSRQNSILFIINCILLFLTHGALAWSGQLGASPVVQVGGFLISITLCILLSKSAHSRLGILSLCIAPLYFVFPASDDLNRYIWEAWVILDGQSPYQFPPEAIELQHLRDKQYWPWVNHPDLSAAYPPLVQYIYSGLISFGWNPYSTLKVFHILIYTLTSWGLILSLKQQSLPLNRVLLWSANPFALIFLAGESHLDIMMICSLVWAYYFYQKSSLIRTGLLLGCSVALKYFSIIALALFLHKKWGWKVGWICLPLLSLFIYEDIFKSLFTFGTQYQFNGFLYAQLNHLFGSFGMTLAIALILIVLCFHWLTEPRLERNLLYTTLFLSTLLPTIHPWYICLSLPWLVFHYSRPLIILQITLFTGLIPMYTINYQTGVWVEIVEFQYFIWLPFILSWVWERIENPPESSRPFQSRPIQSLSIIIPIHNEAERLPELNQKLRTTLKGLPDVEVIYVHSGAQDGCAAIAQSLHLNWLTSSRPGRGYQIESGIQQSQGDLICILHADTDFSAGLFQKMIQEMNQNPHLYSGWCPMDFDHTKGLSIVRLLNSFRARSLQITFGDQCQFFRREAYDRLMSRYGHVIPPMPLMEDVELAMRLKELGPALTLSQGVQASSRRWQKANRWKNAWLIIKICTLYLLARRLGFAPSDSQYFQELYYGSPAKN